MSSLKLFLILSCLGLAACASTNSELYYWGNYEGLIYDMYNKPGNAPPELQIDKITEDMEIAKSKGRQIPPGVHAHLGMMYAQVGNMPAAEVAFQNEKALFPESAKMIDGMLERARKVNKKTPAKRVAP